MSPLLSLLILACVASCRLGPANPPVAEARAPTELSGRLSLVKLGLVPCGPRPKQVLFSPDGKELLISLLGGRGVDVVSMSDLTLKTVPVGAGRDKAGFVEIIYDRAGDSYLLSQMTTAEVHRLDRSSKSLRASYATGGKWSKVIALSPDNQWMAVSNWVSHDVSLLERATGKLVRKLGPYGKTPRGLAFTPDGARLYVAHFGSGDLVWVDTATWKRAGRLKIGGALRHVVMGPRGDALYVNDMARAKVHEVSVASGAVVRSLTVGPKPNTMAISPLGRYLFVSCRGPNDRKSYMLRSPVPGEVHVIDLAGWTVAAVLPGGNQPTGLAISPSGDRLAFSNFQDDSVDLYAIRYHDSP